MEHKKSGGVIISPRTGRPKINSPKNIDLKIRIDEKTNAKLLEKCKKENKTKAEIVREAIINWLKK